jgi:tRNA(Ile)-lysidine synthetase-like protein
VRGERVGCRAILDVEPFTPHPDPLPLRRKEGDEPRYNSNVPDPELIAAIDTVPPGRWAVAVSGGADSVALLALLRGRDDLHLHVVHLDHQLRGDASTEDARFVADLARRWNLPCTIARRDEIEPMVADLPANPSARYRRLRLALFADVVRAHDLNGVILAHHADDQAETVLQRLLRASGPMGLAGMGPTSELGPLRVVRPLLRVRHEQLVDHLRAIDQPWRTDASNESPAQLRGRLRAVLRRAQQLTDALVDLAASCGALRDWVSPTAPALEERFAAAQLADLPHVLARASAARWLRERGSPADELTPDVLGRLVTMSRDAASPARQHFPGRVLVRRRGGEMFVDGGGKSGQI